MKKILLFILAVNLVYLTASAQTRIYEQFASSVIAYSTQFNATDYSANQILGIPNRYPQCSGDSVWAPSAQNAGREFIVVGYSTPQLVNTIRIYQTRGQGGVDTVYLRNAATGTWQTVYTATAAAVTCSEYSGLLEIKIATTAYNVNAVRIAVNTSITEWQEFDAVGIANFYRVPNESPQYASSVIAFSSEFNPSPGNYSAARAIGPPDAGGALHCGTHINAWASLTENGQREFIILGYTNPGFVSRVRIYQASDPGAVDTVYLRDAATGTWHSIFDTTGNSKKCPQQKLLEINFTQTTYMVDAVRLALNSPLAAIYWNEIDAVEILTGDLTVLPVNLKSFTALKNNNAVSLKWTIENEVNVSHYEVERSKDARTFEKITSVSAGKSNNAANYTALDNKPLKGVSYYRLKSVDLDGKFSYSGVVKLDFSGKFTVLISPNPANNRIHIQGAENFRLIQILDVNGKLIRKLQPGGDNKFDVQFLKAGVYYVRLLSDNDTHTYKLIKK